MNRETLLEQSTDELASAAEIAQRAAVELVAASKAPTTTPAQIMSLAHAVAAESHRLVMAGLQVRAAASRMGAIGVLSQNGGGK